MNWKEKIEFIASCLEDNEEIEQDFYLKDNGAAKAFLDTLVNAFPFVQEDYLEFLKISDGADIAQCRLLSEREFKSGSSLYSDRYLKYEWMPFGYEAGGDPLLLNRNGKIFLGEGKSSSNDALFIADSFSDFLCNVLMGQRYASIFRVLDTSDQLEFYNEELEEGDDPWLTFLVKNNWISV